MPRSGEKARRRLQQAALELFAERGYELTTAVEIATKAGVTERTFFRHFTDKREVLFDGETVLRDILTSSVSRAPAEAGPWETLFIAFRSAEPLLLENRPLSEPRQTRHRQQPRASGTGACQDEIVDRGASVGAPRAGRCPSLGRVSSPNWDGHIRPCRRVLVRRRFQRSGRPSHTSLPEGTRSVRVQFRDWPKQRVTHQR